MKLTFVIRLLAFVLIAFSEFRLLDLFAGWLNEANTLLNLAGLLGVVGSLCATAAAVVFVFTVKSKKEAQA